MFKIIWHYRGFIFESVKRNFQSQYSNSLLGALWTVINPLALIVIYTVIFSQLMKAKIEGIDNIYGYSIHLCIGIIFWTLFSESTSKLLTVFLDNANLIKKINFPRVNLAIIIILNALLNFSIVFCIFIIFLILSNTWPGLNIVYIFPVILLQIAFTLGVGITFGILNVFFRDIGQFYSVILQFWFWFTPIVYPLTILDDRLQAIILSVNPMAQIISAYQDLFLRAKIPDWYALSITIVLTILLNILALFLYKKCSDEIVDEL